MKEIKCVSDKFKDAKGYALFKLKMLFEKLYLIPVILIILFFLTSLQTGEWDFFLKFSCVILGISIFILSFRYYFADRRLFKKSFHYDENKIHVNVFNKNREVEYSKLKSVKLYKNFLLIEWIDISFPWLISIKVESINDPSRSSNVLEFIQILRSNAQVRDNSNVELNIF